MTVGCTSSCTLGSRPALPLVALWLGLLAAFQLLAPPCAQARMGLLVGEPFGSFGTMMPQGHAGIYLASACVDTPVHLRPCQPGELGAVISRYHDLRHPDRDWMAFPLPVFLYGTSDLAHVPATMTAAIETDIRERYWRSELSDLIPARITEHGDELPPRYGDWQEGIGAAFDRRLIMYNFDTTPAQDTAAFDWLNNGGNHRSYTLARHNCADFAADLLRFALPPQVTRRNFLADFNVTTPKNLARQVDTYGRAHPELHLQVYEIPQIPGTLRRSRPIRGAAESLLTTKRYFAVVVVLQPELVLADWIIYEKRGKWHFGEDAVLASPATWRRDLQPAPSPTLAGATTDDASPDKLPSPASTASEF